MKQLTIILLALLGTVVQLYAEPQSGAPGPATELETYFTPGSLSGQFRFTVPRKTVGGSDLSGMINYRISINGVQYTTGSGYTGVSTSKAITVQEAGEYTFTIVFYNSAGDGEPASITATIGGPSASIACSDGYLDIRSLMPCELGCHNTRHQRCRAQHPRHIQCHPYARSSAGGGCYIRDFV